MCQGVALAFELTVIDSDSPTMGLRSIALTEAAQLEVVGTACPPVPEWGENHNVYLAVDLAVAAAAPRVVEPDLDGGHLSLTLVPEVTGGVLIEPDANGSWAHTWAGDLAGGDHTLSAVCVGGGGLEAGFVHYGQQSFVVLAPS